MLGQAVNMMNTVPSVLMMHFTWSEKISLCMQGLHSRYWLKGNNRGKKWVQEWVQGTRINKYIPYLMFPNYITSLLTSDGDLNIVAKIQPFFFYLLDKNSTSFLIVCCIIYHGFFLDSLSLAHLRLLRTLFQLNHCTTHLTPLLNPFTFSYLLLGPALGPVFASAFHVLNSHALFSLSASCSLTAQS